MNGVKTYDSNNMFRSCKSRFKSISYSQPVTQTQSEVTSPTCKGKLSISLSNIIQPSVSCETDDVILMFVISVQAQKLGGFEIIPNPPQLLHLSELILSNSV